MHPSPPPDYDYHHRYDEDDRWDDRWGDDHYGGEDDETDNMPHRDANGNPIHEDEHDDDHHNAHAEHHYDDYSGVTAAFFSCDA